MLYCTGCKQARVNDLLAFVYFHLKLSRDRSLGQSASAVGGTSGRSRVSARQ